MFKSLLAGSEQTHDQGALQQGTRSPPEILHHSSKITAEMKHPFVLLMSQRTI